MTRQISRKVGKEYEEASEPRFVEESKQDYLLRIGANRPRKQRELDLIFGGWE